MKKITILLLTFISILSFISCEDDEKPKAETTIASFSMSDSIVYIDDEITFTNSSKNASYYIWNFGDDNISSTENPTHSYPNTGTYDVSLIAIGNGTSDTVVNQVAVIKESSDESVGIFEGVGITGISIYESTWADLKALHGTDTIDYVKYNSTGGYYYHIVDYKGKGLTFFIYTESSEKMLNNGIVYGIALWGPDYSGGTTAKGITIGSTILALKNAYGNPEDKITGTQSTYAYTYYSYGSLGIDFLDFNDGYIFEIDIYYPDEATSALKVHYEEVKEILRNHRSGIMAK